MFELSFDSMNRQLNESPSIFCFFTFSYSRIYFLNDDFIFIPMSIIIASEIEMSHKLNGNCLSIHLAIRLIKSTHTFSDFIRLESIFLELGSQSALALTAAATTFVNLNGACLELVKSHRFHNLSHDDSLFVFHRCNVGRGEGFHNCLHVVFDFRS